MNPRSASSIVRHVLSVFAVGFVTAIDRRTRIRYSGWSRAHWRGPVRTRSLSGQAAPRHQAALEHPAARAGLPYHFGQQCEE
jgi:hypothetical protein